MDLHQYYKENKDEINSSIMEIAIGYTDLRVVQQARPKFTKKTCNGK